MMPLISSLIVLLAQAADAATTQPASQPATGMAQAVQVVTTTTRTAWAAFLDNAFALTILFIFLTAIVTVLIQQRRKDKCLVLFRKYHVSYITTNGQSIWGDLIVYAQGLELVFDAPHVNERFISKESALIYDNELPMCLAICRVLEGQTGPEKKAREKQITRSFNPGIIRQTWRWTRNLFNTLRDAFGKALSAAIGQLAKVRTQDVILNQQRGNVDQIGQTLLSSMGNAYEPMLERHIGKPVVLELATPNTPDKKPIQLPGYLADYSDRFVAVFNVDHTPEKVIHLTVTENIEHPSYTITLDPQHIFISARGEDVLVIRWMEVQGQRADLAAVLINGTTLRMNTRGSLPVKLELAITRKIDIVCPRTMGKVKFGSGGNATDRQDWAGRAPEEDQIEQITPKASTSIAAVTTVTTAAVPAAESNAKSA